MEIILLSIGLAVIITGVIRNELAIVRIERNQREMLTKLRVNQIAVDAMARNIDRLTLTTRGIENNLTDKQ